MSPCEIRKIMAVEVSGMAVELCTVEATVPTGFEEVAREEAFEKFGTECRSARGRILFQAPITSVKNVLHLGGIDNCRVQMYENFNFGFADNAHDCLSCLQLMVKKVNWAEGLTVWKEFYKFDLPVQPVPERIPTDDEIVNVCIMTRKPEPKKKEKGGQGKNRHRGKGGKGQRKRGKPEEMEQEVPKDSEGPEALSVDGFLDSCLKSSSEGKNLPHDTEENNAARASFLCLNTTERDKELVRRVLPEDKVTPDENGKKETNPLGTRIFSIQGDSLQEEDREVSSELSAELPNNPEVAKEAREVGGDFMEASKVTDKVNVSTSEAFTLNLKENCNLPELDSVAPNETAGGTDESQEHLKHSDDTQQVDPSGESSTQPQTRKCKHDPTKPTFRVTCSRTGENHSFDSMSAAASFGSAVQTYFGWNVDMKNFDIEVILHIDNEEVSVGIALTRESLHYRNLVAFGPTTLRPTICHNMLRMCKVRDGHIVCDPMCGTGSISIQGSLAWPCTFQICGENHAKALEKVSLNTQALNNKRATRSQGALKMDALRWDACHLPLRDNIVDIFVTDLPFGNRIGSRVDNRKLYPKVLNEMARVGRTGARACLLTEDKANIMKAIQQTNRYWQRRRVLSVNVGGLSAGVFLLLRTATAYRKQEQVLKRSSPPPEPPAAQSAESSESTSSDKPADCKANDLPSLSSAVHRSFSNMPSNAGSSIVDSGNGIVAGMGAAASVPFISDEMFSASVDTGAGDCGVVCETATSTTGAKSPK